MADTTGISSVVSWGNKALNWITSQASSGPGPHESIGAPGPHESSAVATVVQPVIRESPRWPVLTSGQPAPRRHTAMPTLGHGAGGGWLLPSSSTSSIGPLAAAASGSNNSSQGQNNPGSSRRTTVIFGKKNTDNEPSCASGSSGYMNMKNIHKFVIDLNKRATAKQLGVSQQPGAGNEDSVCDKSAYGLLVFAGIPSHNMESSVSESPAMALIRESVGTSECPTMEADLLFMAAVTAACGRPKDAERYTQTLAKHSTLQGRDMFENEWVAVRASVESMLNTLATQWRRLKEMDSAAFKGPQGSGLKKAIIKELQLQKSEIRDKILRRCRSLVTVAMNSLSNPSSNLSTRIFYLQMLGTIFRFLISLSENVASYQCEHLADKYFKAALTAAEGLPPYHTLRIECATSYACFLYQELQEKQEALELARRAFSEATNQLETLDEKDYNAAIPTLKKLLKLINWWSSDNNRVLISSAVV